jgi:hypothetical protein
LEPVIFSADSIVPLSGEISKRGKSPGTQVQHTLASGTVGTEFRHFLTFTYGTM